MATRRLVDRLPDALWRVGNVWLFPFGALHFCVEPAGHDQSVRTVEWDGQVVLRGRRSAWLPGQNEHQKEGRVIQFSTGELVAAGAIVGVLTWWSLAQRRH